MAERELVELSKEIERNARALERIRAAYAKITKPDEAEFSLMMCDAMVKQKYEGLEQATLLLHVCIKPYMEWCEQSKTRK